MTREERSDEIRVRRYSEKARRLEALLRDGGPRRSALACVRAMSRACDEHSRGGSPDMHPADPRSLLRAAALQWDWPTDVDGWPTV